MNKSNSLPLLYSLKNCPYALRARIALFKAKQPIILHDVQMDNKPNELIAVSPKGTVPVLVISKSRVVEQSLDIMLWALAENDPDDLLHHDDPNTLYSMLSLISQFDHEFKDLLEKYKCAKRYHDASLTDCRLLCLLYINELERRLNQHDFLISANESLADIAIFPFIRQFARVERQWYRQAPYPKLRLWLDRYLQSAMFSRVMSTPSDVH